jgi:disks large-associated protein 5
MIVIFRSVLDSETKRLEIICQDWLHIQSSTNDLPSEASGLISAAVGHTQLLLKKKFRQFNGLIDRCEKTEVITTEAPVMSSDLKGFWDMVCLEVKEIVAYFLYFGKLTGGLGAHSSAVVKSPRYKPEGRGFEI